MLMSVVDCLVFINVIALRFTFVVLRYIIATAFVLAAEEKNAIFICRRQKAEAASEGKIYGGKARYYYRYIW